MSKWGYEVGALQGWGGSGDSGGGAQLGRVGHMLFLAFVKSSKTLYPNT